MTTRILVPPGIGDIYWVMVKLRSFLAANNLTDPELTVVSDPDPLEAYLRGIEFIEMFPWVRVSNLKSVPNDRSLQHIWDEAYKGPGRSVFPDVMGYDYFIAYNGVINSGGYLESCDEYACNWTVPPAVHIHTPTKYMLCFFPFLGTYQSHEADFPLECIAEVINRQVLLTGFIPIFLGSKTEAVYDEKQKDLIGRIPHAMDLVGRTSLTKVMGLLRGTSLIFGYHSGIPNLGAAMGKPTVLLWDDRYPDSTSLACIPPKVRRKTYIPLATKTVTADSIESAIEAARIQYEFRP